MGSRIIKIAMLAIAFGIMFNTNAQEISEDEVSITVLKWFYNHYDSPEMPKWEMTKSETNEDLLKVSFKYKGQNLVAVYTKQGKKAYESVSYQKNSMPEPIVDYAGTNFDKFKILSVYRHTNYAYGARVNTDTNYEMVVKVNGEIASVWFGETMSKHSNFDSSNLALK